VGERAFGMKSELEKGDDPVHCGIIGYESDYSHLVTACFGRKGQGPGELLISIDIYIDSKD